MYEKSGQRGQIFGAGTPPSPSDFIWIGEEANYTPTDLRSLERELFARLLWPRIKANSRQKPSAEARLVTVLNYLCGDEKERRGPKVHQADETILTEVAYELFLRHFRFSDSAAPIAALIREAATKQSEKELSHDRLKSLQSKLKRSKDRYLYLASIREDYTELQLLNDIRVINDAIDIAVRRGGANSLNSALSRALCIT